MLILLFVKMKEKKMKTTKNVNKIKSTHNYKDETLLVFNKHQMF